MMIGRRRGQEASVIETMMGGGRGEGEVMADKDRYREEDGKKKGLCGTHIQWGESSPAKHGGAYISAVVWTRILAITEMAIGRPQAPPNLVGFHLARIFGPTGKEQPSPPLHLAAAARLLAPFLSRDVRLLVSLDLFTLNHKYFSHRNFIFPSML